MDASVRRKGYLFVALLIGAFALVSLSSARRGSRFSALPSTTPVIGVVEVFDVIETSEHVTDWIYDLEHDEDVDALLVRIDSPGGSVAPSQEIYDALMRARKVKPVFVSMASVAASGGYYIAAAADHIVANPGTLTGSIGVIFPMFDFRDAMDKHGIGWRAIKSGKFKDVGTPFRHATTSETALLQTVVNEAYEQFIAAIMAGRGDRIDESTLRRVADGRIVSGEQALTMDLIDQLGGYHEAITAVAQKINADPAKLTFRFPPKDYEAYFDWLLSGEGMRIERIGGSPLTQQMSLMYLWDGPGGQILGLLERAGKLQ